MKQQIPKTVALKDFIVFLPSLLLILGLILFLPSDDNNKGVKFFSNKDFTSAVESFSQSIDKDYSNQRSYLNLALSQDKNNNPMKAVDIYSFITKNFTSEAKFYSHFNQGELNGRLGKINEALKNYQAALEFQIKKREVKENIEWLFLNRQNQKSKKKQKQDSQTQNQQKENLPSSEEENNNSSQKQGSQTQNQQKENLPSSEEENNNSSQKQDFQTQNQQKEKLSSSEEENNNSSQKQGSQTQNQQKEKPSSSEEENNNSSQKQGSQTQNQQKEKLSSSKQKNENQISEEKAQMKVFNKIETKAILDAIESQESDIRSRQFQKKSRQQPSSGKKDW